ncbi:efflux RND transporter periplasmic adaptor subunit [Pyxidicoccus sp. MSG2]|uniref:efflux RND transporter periplasmic adaptor subunit n=1 Tax=Pyxidicoccus sp. MSG2 TaxID=2996790 RepID=UPI00226F1AD5|nr:efflux RND transporter periplasmic adaptor subunit [Pyxidicoccus sp. MSG2]MCY1024043.1 efflux RND transporter periplasmic adaptor subunit [Pyxidicoccus sp. MSG2]
MTRYMLLCLTLSSLLLGCSRKEETPPGGAEPKAGAGETKAAEGDAAPGEGEGHGEGHEEIITLPPEALKNAQLQRAHAQLKPLSRGLTAAARISFTQKGVAQVAARVPGRIASIEVNLGQKVKKGDVLGYLESPELGQARADYLSAATKSRVAEENFRREKELLGKGISSEREARQAEAEFSTAQADMNAAEGRLHALGLNDAEIRALKADEHYSSRFPARSPLDGTVVQIGGTVGASVDASTPLYTVADLRELWVVLDVFESQLRSVRVGQPVALTVSALGDRRFEGRVEYIGDVVDEKTRSVPVRVAVPNADGALKAGMFAQAEVLTTEGTASDAGTPEPTRLVIPREAVQKVGEEQFVFVPVKENQFKPVKVRAGASSAREVEVLSGIEAGTEVVTQGAFILKSELSKESMGEHD